MKSGNEIRGAPFLACFARSGVSHDEEYAAHTAHSACTMPRLPGAQRAGQRPSFPRTIFFFPCPEALQPVILVTACQPARQQNPLRPPSFTLRSQEVFA